MDDRPLQSAEAGRGLNAPVVEICPVCHYTLPDRWHEGRATCPAMAGARAGAAQ